MTIEMIETRINGRWPLKLPEHRAARPEWPWWEAARLAAMHHHLEPGDVVYDIGAEEGDMPALWASWGCDVVLFEPNPRVWPNIKAVFEANDLAERVAGMWVGFAGREPSNLAKSWDFHQEHVGTDDHKEWPRCAHGPVIGDHGFLNLSERPDVPVTTITRAAVGWADGRWPTAITIDVEGAELEVLQGAIPLLRDGDRPKIWVSIHPEFMADMYGVTDGVNAVRAFMAELDYDEQFLAIDHEHHWMFLPR